MKIRTHLLIAMLLATGCAATPVSPPVERTLTDEFGRTTEVRVTGVTADAVEFMRLGDNTRFTLPVKKLSEADQAFAAELFKKIEDARPMPDTPWLIAVRKDFQAYNPERKLLDPLGPKAYARDKVFVVAFRYLYDRFTFRDDVSDRARPFPDQAPILWIFFTGGERPLFELIGEKLPPGHAMLSYDVREKTMSRGQEVQEGFITDWFNRKRKDRGTAPLSFTPTEKERAELISKLAKVVPVYWSNVAISFPIGNSDSNSQEVYSAVRRDGTSIQFRGGPVIGTRQTVMRVLRDYAAELE